MNDERMKICIFSDSHGYAGNMIAAIELERPAMCFFLGDGERDLAVLEEKYPDLPIYYVRGNCDFRSEANGTIICDIGGVRIYATHGHLDNVKYEPELDTLTSRAVNAGAEIALFGHTHRQHISINRGVTLVNPGSIGRGGYPSYAVLEIDSGKYSFDLRSL